MAITLRLATADDVGAVVDLVESAYRGDESTTGWTTEADLLDGQRTDVEAIEAVVAAPQAHLILATADSGELVGCCVIENRAGGQAYFGTFAVRPGLQGGGIGNQLIVEAERTARDDWSCETVEMTVIGQREDLIAWYLRRGYLPTGEMRPFPYGDERFGLPRREDLYFVVLAKPITSE